MSVDITPEIFDLMWDSYLELIEKYFKEQENNLVLKMEFRTNLHFIPKAKLLLTRSQYKTLKFKRNVHKEKMMHISEKEANRLWHYHKTEDDVKTEWIQYKNVCNNISSIKHEKKIFRIYTHANNDECPCCMEKDFFPLVQQIIPDKDLIKVLNGEFK